MGLLTAIYRHLVMDRGKAFLLDFIGRGCVSVYRHSPFQILTRLPTETSPNTFTVLSLDVLITVFQVTFCILFYEQRTTLGQ